MPRTIWRLPISFAGSSDTADPWRIARSPAAQIERRFPDLTDPFARPEARLAGLVSRVSARALAPQGRRMALVIDGLDGRPPGNELREVLACLPHRSRSGPEPPCGGEWIHGSQLTAAS